MVSVIKNHKRIVTISLIAFIAILFSVIVIINASKAGVDYKIDNDLYITNVENKYENGINTFKGELYTKGNTLEVKSVDITFKDARGNVITVLHGYVQQQIELGETVTIVAQTDIDVHNAKVSYAVNYIVPEEDNTEEGDGE